MDKTKIKKVHVVYKTHLDIGFTDLAENVMDQYVSRHIPHSVDLATQINTPDEKKFIWTVGSYIIDYYLEHAEEEAKRKLEEAIKRGDICWHGLACTTHTELLDKELFEFDLKISQDLDKKFGKKTIAAKMTDVPGHTKAMVESFVKYGIQYLHIGVNPSSMVPEIPFSFVWKTGDHDVIVQYSAEYGAPCYVEGMDEVLEFAHTGDNLGPQSKESIEEEIQRLQAMYPNAKVEASTMDLYAERVIKYKHTLPVIEEEIGDTWIHGIASDPLKIMRYRALIEMKDQWEKEGLLDAEKTFYKPFMMNLLLVAEHTWGLDFKKYLADFKNWEKTDFQNARKEDTTSLEFLTNRNAFMLEILQEDFKKYRGGEFKGSYSFYEKSYKEQMEYIWNAIAVLPQDLKQQAKEKLADLEAGIPDTLEDGVRVRPHQIITIGEWNVAFGGTGEIVYLAKDQSAWIDKGVFGKVVYTTYNAQDCVENYYSYNRNFKETHCWSEADFSKPGVEVVEDLKHMDYVFGVNAIRVKEKKVVLELEGNPQAVQKYGCPAHAKIEYQFEDVIRCRLHWSQKDANKMPEALWFDMNFDVENVNRWHMKKMGHLVSPNDVVRGGNRKQHCVEEMLYHGADGKISVKNIHSPLISVGGHWLYGEYREIPDLKEGFSYCLFNNKWGTNFKMWCEEDCTFEYEICIENH